MACIPSSHALTHPTLERNTTYMKTRIPKARLLDILETNRGKHRDIFLKAIEGYKKYAIAEFEKRIDAIRSGKKWDRYIHLDEPKDQTSDYDRIIGMVKANTEDGIELSEDDYRKYVLDKWEWKKAFASSAKNYTFIPEEDEE